MKCHSGKFLMERVFMETVLFSTRMFPCGDEKLNMATLGYCLHLSGNSRLLFPLTSILSLLPQLFCVFLSPASSASLKLSRKPHSLTSRRDETLHPQATFVYFSAPLWPHSGWCVCTCVCKREKECLIFTYSVFPTPSPSSHASPCFSHIFSFSSHFLF